MDAKTIPGLDGIRAFSALCVFGYHAISPTIPGTYGVIVFFVLSGFLITWLLLREHASTGTVSLSGFYKRRAARILPAYYAYVILHLLLIGSTTMGGIAAFLYLGNYYNASQSGMWGLGHTWSLAVEEQFYILWPLALAFALRKRKLDQLLEILPLIVVLVCCLRFGLIFYGHQSYATFAFETRCDALATGCLLAIALHRRPSIPSYLLHPFTGIFSLLLIFGFAQLPSMLLQSVGYSVAAIVAPILIVQAVTFRPWLLINPVVRYIGRISYSLYLYHLMILYFCWKAVGESAVLRPLEFAVTLAVASASYFLLERWSKRLRPASAGRDQRISETTLAGIPGANLDALY